MLNLKACFLIALAFVLGCNTGHETNETKIPCIMLEKVEGGLGNQMFAVASIAARAHASGQSFTLPLKQANAPGYRKSPTYWDSFFLPIVGVATDASQCNPVRQDFKLSQFEQIPTLSIKRESVKVNGMLMNLKEIYEHRKYLRNLFAGDESAEFRHRYPKRNLIIGFRSFLEERRPEWSSKLSYYEAALKKILRPDHVVHIFGEKTGINEFADWVKSKIGDRELVMWPGVRDIEGTSRHMQYMLQGDDFILCNSSYHLWGAILSDSEDSQVAIDSSIEWLSKIGVPSEWMSL